MSPQLGLCHFPGSLGQMRCSVGFVIALSRPPISHVTFHCPCGNRPGVSPGGSGRPKPPEYAGPSCCGHAGPTLGHPRSWTRDCWQVQKKPAGLVSPGLVSVVVQILPQKVAPQNMYRRGMVSSAGSSAGGKGEVWVTCIQPTWAAAGPCGTAWPGPAFTYFLEFSSSQICVTCEKLVGGCLQYLGVLLLTGLSPKAQVSILSKSQI